ncbi:HAD-IIA family hydrolase [Cetobacterium sp. SF1]|uniref:HAD-IIA family hydrolase n=1 Tax=Cetobacterium sp. SF1 TaxID=3417654 RepID=UPI003CF734A8
MKEYKGYLFDIDGTILLGNTIIPGAKEKIEELRKAGKKIRFFTNNSSKTPESYVEKLEKLGIKTQLKEIITAGIVLLDYIQKQYRDKNIFIVGTEEYKNLYRKMGINIIDNIKDFNNNKIDILIVALDTELNFKKIEIACKLLQKNILYFAANEDLVYPIENKVFLPDCKALCNMIELCTGKQPIYFGKPNNIILEYALTSLFLKKEEVVIVGDRLYTDIACGNLNNCDTILVLTGEGTITEKSIYKPTYIFDSIKNI